MSEQTSLRPDQIVTTLETLLAQTTSRVLVDGDEEIELCRFPGGGYVLRRRDGQGQALFDRFGSLKRTTRTAESLVRFVMHQAQKGQE